jgi:membrane protein
MNDYLGNATAADVQGILAKTTLKHNSVWTTIVGAAMLLFAAAGIFGEVQDSINFIWGLKAKPKKGLILMVMNRVLSFSMILVLAFILMVSLLLSSLLSVFLEGLHRHFPEWLVNVAQYADYVIIFFTIATLFMFIFKVLPDAKIRWKDAFTGACISALLFMVGQYLISFYLKKSSVATAYGATASVIVLLLWVYYSSIILYFGAEFTQTYTLMRGRRIEPNRYSVFVQNVQLETKTAVTADEKKATEEQVKKQAEKIDEHGRH